MPGINGCVGCWSCGAKPGGKAIERFRAHFRDMEWLTPNEPATYEATADLFRNLRRRGVTIRSTIDCLIARLAHEHGCAILSRDSDLDRILASGLLRVPGL